MYTLDARLTAHGGSDVRSAAVEELEAGDVPCARAPDNSPPKRKASDRCTFIVPGVGLEDGE